MKSFAGRQQRAAGMRVHLPAKRPRAKQVNREPPHFAAFATNDFIQRSAPTFDVAPVAEGVLPLHNRPQGLPAGIAGAALHPQPSRIHAAASAGKSARRASSDTP